MDKETLLKMAEQAYANVKKARQDLYNATTESIKHQQDLKDKIARAWAEDRVQGSNDKKRDAWLREEFEKEYQFVATAESAEAHARHEYDQALFDVNVIEAYIAIGSM